MRIFALILFLTAFTQAQVKDDISVVQYTAGFASEIS